MIKTDERKYAEEAALAQRMFAHLGSNPRAPLRPRRRARVIRAGFC